MKSKILLAFIVLLGFLVRGIHLLTPTVDSDQAAFGLMSMHIMRGEFPIIQWGFPYMATGESFFAVPFFFFLGPSAFSLNLSVAVQSLIFVLLIYFLGKRLFSENTGLFAALFSALGPSYLIVHCVLARGAYVETLIFGSLSLLYASKILFPAQSGDGRAFHFFLLGLFVGIGLWFHFLIVFFAVPIALCFILKPRLLFSGKMAYALAGFMLGSSPFWVHNIMHHFESLKFVFSHQEKTHTFIEGLKNILMTGFPVIWGVLENGSKKFYSNFSFLPGLLWIGFIIYALKTVVQEIWKEHKISPLFFVLSFLIFYVLILNQSQFVEADTRRYFIPIYAGFALLWAFVMDGIFKRSSLWGGILLFCFTVSHLWTNYADATIFHSKPLGKYERMLAREEKLFSFLKQKKLTNLYYLDYWMGFRLNFTSKETLTFAQAQSERYEPYREKVEKSPNPSWILRDDSINSELKRMGGLCHSEKFSRWWIFSRFQPPVSEYSEIPPEEIKAFASHQKEHISNIFDRRNSTSWSTEIPQNKDMWVSFDLGKERDLGLVRFWNPDYLMHNYPMRISVEISSDGRSWTEILPDIECDYYYWSGPRLYYWDMNYRWELRLPSLRARWIRIRQHQQDKTNPWIINEAFFYEISGEKKNVNQDAESLISGISVLGLNKIYADRWLNFQIKQKTGDRVKTSPLDTRSVFDRPDRHERIVFAGNTGFVLEVSDATSFEKRLAEQGVSLEKKNFGCWTLFWLKDKTQAQYYNEQLEYVWLGFTTVRAYSQTKSQFLFEKGNAALGKGLLEDASSYYQESLVLYPNHQEARRKWIEVLKQMNDMKKAEQEQIVLDEATKPEFLSHAKFENGVEFLGYTVSRPEIKPGETIRITFFWKLSREIENPTGVFVHFEKEKIYFQADHNFIKNDWGPIVPLAGGEFFKQEKEIFCPKDVPPGNYDVRIGLFDLKSGKRWEILRSERDHAHNRLKIGVQTVK